MQWKSLSTTCLPTNPGARPSLKQVASQFSRRIVPPVRTNHSAPPVTDSRPAVRPAPTRRKMGCNEEAFFSTLCLGEALPPRGEAYASTAQ